MRVAPQVRNPVSPFIECLGCGEEFDPREIDRGNATIHGYCSLDCMQDAHYPDRTIWQSWPLRWFRRRLRNLHDRIEPDIKPYWRDAP